MGEATGIGWTDATFNPWWGCSKVSPGCSRCYAEGLADRYGHDVWGVTKPRRTFGDKHWAEPLRWNAAAVAAKVRRRVFCASMADVFESHPQLDAERARLWELVDATPDLDWQLLTKRPENVWGMIPGRWFRDWPAHVWLGTSTEDQRRADERVPELLRLPAPVRFLSVEPLIGPVALRCDWLLKLAWVIVGGESGPRRRTMESAWLEDVAAHTVSHGVPLYVKQDSGSRPGTQGGIPERWWAFKQSPVSAPAQGTIL
jgi:protein gp37